MAISAGWNGYPVIFKTAPNYTPRKTRERAKLESIHQDQSTHNREHMNLSSSCDYYPKIYRGLDNDKTVCETERFPNGKENFSDGAWCMERFHDRPFQDFVAHETHRLILNLARATTNAASI